MSKPLRWLFMLRGFPTWLTIIVNAGVCCMKLSFRWPLHRWSSSKRYRHGWHVAVGAAPAFTARPSWRLASRSSGLSPCGEQNAWGNGRPRGAWAYVGWAWHPEETKNSNTKSGLYIAPLTLCMPCTLPSKSIHYRHHALGWCWWKLGRCLPRLQQG